MTDREMIAWLWTLTTVYPEAWPTARRLETLSRIEQARAGKTGILGTLKTSTELDKETQDVL